MPSDDGASPGSRQWADLLQQLGAEVAGPLSVAQQHIDQLTETGQIDRRSLRQLKLSVDAARRAGKLGQQLAHLASVRLRLSCERLPVAQVLRAVLAQRSAETQARGLLMRQMLEPVEIWNDGALLSTLLDALLDWALTHTRTGLEWRLSRSGWPAAARLSCSFATREAELLGEVDDSPDEALDTDSLAWHLVEQTAATMGVGLQRKVELGLTVVTLEFSELAVQTPPLGVPASARGEQPLPATALKGGRLLIVSNDRLLQAEVQEAIRHLGLAVECLASLEDAQQLSPGSTPCALIFDGALRSATFDPALRAWLQQEPSLGVIELVTGDAPTRLSTATADGVARIARAHLPDALPGLLTFEFTRHR